MARINLLPWRAERRKQRQREFQTMLGMAALGGVLLAIMVWFYYDRQISGQEDRNRFLQAEIDKVKKQNEEIAELDAKKNRLLARKSVIEELQANRSQMVHLFDSLVRTIPDGVILSTLKQEGEMLTLEGTAQSNARVSHYMRNLEGSGWMTKPDLSIIEARKDNKAPAAGASRALPYTFSLKVRLANPNATEDGEQVIDPAMLEEAGVDAGTAATDAAAGAAPTPAVDGAQAEAAQPAPAQDSEPAANAAGGPAS